MKYEILPFDSDLFGYGVARINSTDLDSTSMIFLLKELSGKHIKLAYWAINPRDTISNLLAKKNGGLLVDEKTIFIKNIGDKEYVSDKKIISYFGIQPNQNLVSLAFQSGEYSRFKIDKNFKNSEFEKLYRAWIERSLSGEIAKDVLVYKDKGGELGLITIGEKNNRADIGIFSVDEKSRGKSIGTRLVNCAFQRAADLGYNKIQAVTQADNVIACSFYEKQGFKIERIENIYHFWL